MADWQRALTDTEQRLIRAARRKAQILYAGVHTGHRSCGIALAETFGLPTAPYQALRRGGITGCGECGVRVGARMVLGQILGDPDPTGPVTDVLRAAMSDLEARYGDRVPRGAAPGHSWVCNTLVAPLAPFQGPARHDHCTAMATEAAALIAEVLVRHGQPVHITGIAGVPQFDPNANC